MEQTMEAFRVWLGTTMVAHFMNEKVWAWPVTESLHFFGLTLLMGTVGFFDLRLLGFAKRIPIGALHKLIPWGILGFCINLITGACFFAAAPDQYMYNPSFQIKMLFIALAGINVIAFYALTFRVIQDGAGEAALRRARVAGAASLIFWIGVMSCGRLLTFYRPPFHWCFWC